MRAAGGCKTKQKIDVQFVCACVGVRKIQIYRKRDCCDVLFIPRYRRRTKRQEEDETERGRGVRMDCWMEEDARYLVKRNPTWEMEREREKERSKKC
jgi:hypothetical protein